MTVFLERVLCLHCNQFQFFNRVISSSKTPFPSKHSSVTTVRFQNIVFPNFPGNENLQPSNEIGNGALIF